MVRTRADNTARKAVAAKAPRKILGASSAGASSSVAGLSSPAGKYAGGNAACSRPTPEWQKGIGTFFQKNETKVSTDKENEDPVDLEVGESSTTTKEAGDGSSMENSSQGSSSTETKVKTKKNGLIDSDSDED